MTLQEAIDRRCKEKLLVSLAARPGTTGETFYSTLFDYHGIDAEYRACRCEDIDADMALARQHCVGISLTMPYKHRVMVDQWMDAALLPINTVVVVNNILKGYNCDLRALEELLPKIIKNKTLSVLGDGAMAQNVLHVARDNKAVIKHYSRHLGNWQHRHDAADVVINTTSLGMTQDESPLESINADVVIDCVIGDTRLIQIARQSNKKYISGADIYVEQFKHQFKVYTGIAPDPTIVAKIAKEFFND